MTLLDSLEPAITVDEIGIVGARLDPYWLKATYQPVFQVSAGSLKPVGASAGLRATRDGRALAISNLAVQASEAAGGQFGALKLALEIRNHQHIGCDETRLFCEFEAALALDAGAALERLELAAQLLAGEGIATDRLVCMIAGRKDIEQQALVRLAAAIRLHGFALGIDDFGEGFPAIELVEMLRPDILRIDGAWFGRVATVPRAASLLKPLFAGLHGAGAQILVDGIALPIHLEAALDSGADHVQGPLVGSVKLAGDIFPDADLPVTEYLKRVDNVVSLAERRRANQRR